MPPKKKGKGPVIDPALLLLCRATFERFDPKATGLVSHSVVSWMSRAIGRTPSNKEIEDILETMPPPPNVQPPLQPGKPKPKNYIEGKTINFEQFIEVIARPQMYEPSEKDIRDAFQAFDIADKGWLNTMVHGGQLQEFAEKFDFEECREFMRLADFEGKGKIYYDKFITRMFSKNPVPKKPKEKKKKKPKVAPVQQLTEEEQALLEAEAEALNETLNATAGGGGEAGTAVPPADQPAAAPDAAPAAAEANPAE